MVEVPAVKPCNNSGVADEKVRSKATHVFVDEWVESYPGPAVSVSIPANAPSHAKASFET